MTSLLFAMHKCLDKSFNSILIKVLLREFNTVGEKYASFRAEQGTQERPQKKSEISVSPVIHCLLRSLTRVQLFQCEYCTLLSYVLLCSVHYKVKLCSVVSCPLHFTETEKATRHFYCQLIDRRHITHNISSCTVIVSRSKIIRKIFFLSFLSFLSFYSNKHENYSH